MRTLYNAATLLLLFTVLGQAQTGKDAQPQGSIAGTVTNDEGEPIGQASVCTRIPRRNGSSSSCGSVQTDQNGQFQLDGLPLGEIGVYGEKMRDGYLVDAEASGTSFPPSGVRKNSRMQTVVLTTDHSLAHVMLTLGPKPGELKLTVSDKLSGKRVQGFNVRWIALPDSRMFSFASGSAYNPWLVPPDTDLIVEVSAVGYQNWFYLDPSNSEPILRLGSGEQKELIVELLPASTPVAEKN
jgi:hypothetical protein